MARAGYCRGCGTYVYLRPDGYCVNGHDPQYVSDPYEAPDASAPPAAFAAPQQPAPQPAAPQYAPQPAPQCPPQYAAPPAPKKRRGGLIAVLVILLLLVCGAGAAVVGVVLGLLPNPTEMLATPTHQKVAAASDFIQAFVTADPVLFRKSIPSDAASAANPAYWIKKLSESSGAGKLESKTWNTDQLTMVFAAGDGTKRQFVLVADPNSDQVSVTAIDVGATDAGSAMGFLMAKELAGYKTLALVGPDGTEFIRFTPEQIKAFETENP